jgi:hypothetical protein
MEQKNKIGQMYGYSVCLTCVITFLISLSSIVGAVFELTDPLHAGPAFSRQANLASFETYKVDVLKSAPDSKDAARSYTPDDATLRAMYEAAKDDKIQSVRFQARSTITVDLLLICVCIAMFTVHWIWLRKLGRKETAAA